MTTSKLKTSLLAVAAAGALGLVLAAAPAGAASDAYQDEDQYSNDSSYDDANDMSDASVANDEEIEVTAPRSRMRGEYGAPIRNVSMTREVRFDDLDLASRDGAEILRGRIRSTALMLCRQLDTMHPVAANDSPPCYQRALEDAMDQADQAIANARNMASNESEDE